MTNGEIIGFVVGGCLTVISAGMPAMIALLKISELHVLINSRLSELIETAKALSRAEGGLAGRNAVQSEIAAQAAAERTNAGDTSRPALTQGPAS